MGPDPVKMGNFVGKGRPFMKYTHSAVICAKTAEPIEMPFRLWAQNGRRNHVLHGGPDPAWKGVILRGKERPVVKYSDTLP